MELDSLRVTGVCCVCETLLLMLEGASDTRLMPPHNGDGGATKEGSGVAVGVVEALLHSTIGLTGSVEGSSDHSRAGSTHAPLPPFEIRLAPTLITLGSRSRRPTPSDVFPGVGSWALVEK